MCVDGIRIILGDEGGNPLNPVWRNPTLPELVSVLSDQGVLGSLGIDPMAWRGDSGLANEVFGDRYGVDWEFAEDAALGLTEEDQT